MSPQIKKESLEHNLPKQDASNPNPFHLSLVVPDLQTVREFYLNILHCKIGRDAGSWIDILFFGHQLTLHQANSERPAHAIDHFGPILEKKEWLGIADGCKTNNINFVMPPTIKNEGLELESGKFIVNDPAGNTIEFKYYLNSSITETN